MPSACPSESASTAEVGRARGRRRRARRPGPKRQRLKKAEAERLSERERVDGGGRPPAHGALGGENGDPADKERRGDGQRSEEISLDNIAHEKSDNQRG